MMRFVSLERGLWVVTLAMILLAAHGSRLAVVPVGPAAPLDGDATAPTVWPESVLVWSRLIVERDPFRLERRPASVRFGEAPPPSGPPGPPRPALAVLGTMGGPPWAAVVAGFPGRTGGVLVRSGERVGDLHVRVVRRDTAIIEGADTTWTLVARRPGP